MTDTPIQAIEHPIICSPWAEPTHHWLYDKETGAAAKQEGRREAGFHTPQSQSQRDIRRGQAELADMLESFVPLPMVNRLRADVKRWREAGYRGASKVTRELLNHWRRPDQERQPFYCQIESAETVIYLAELGTPGRLSKTGFQNFQLSAGDIQKMLRGENPGFEEYTAEDYYPTLVDQPHDADLPGLIRLGCKQATGSGKTIVMAMLIAWSFCNRGVNPASTQYPSGVLVCCPNLTVRERLSVLKTSGKGNYYDLFNLVPGKYRGLLNLGVVEVTNWHRFAPESANKEGDSTYRVVDKGDETPETFLKSRFPTLADRGPLLVLNDEGHHAWRGVEGKVDTSELDAEEKAAFETEKNETVWVAGLDMINQHTAGFDAKGNPLPGIAFCVDLSATPFYIGGSGHPEGRPFPWLVSDFGLIDAIESGITKIPRLPVRDATGRPEPKYYALWKNICEDLKPAEKLAGRAGKPKPEVIWRKAEGALLQLAGQWKASFKEIVSDAPGEDHVPPVMIVVCDNTDIAEEFYRRISGERIEKTVNPDTGKETEVTVYDRGKVFHEYLSNTEHQKRTIRIDSKLLAQAESRTGESKADAAEQLRQLVATVGDKGQPGEHVRCVVSVSMLTEGWDANNVKHILGLRAFGSQLLCEQVVGRGLRRMSYQRDEKGMLSPEYVDVYGIPFSLIPFKGKTSKPQSDRPTLRIKAMPERAAFELKFPIVEGYGYTSVTNRVVCDVDNVEKLMLEPMHEPEASFVKPELGLEPVGVIDSGGPFKIEEQNRQAYYDQTHPQQIAFILSQALINRLLAAGESDAGGRERLVARNALFPQVFPIVDRYIKTRVEYNGLPKCELGLDRYMGRMLERLSDAISWADEEGTSTLMPILYRNKEIGTSADINFTTTKPTQQVSKSHVNRVVADTLSWEQSVAFQLERDASPVECFVKNDHLDLVIPYEYDGIEHGYLPDFLCRMKNGSHLILEVKGQPTDQTQAKHQGAKRWVQAVNNWGQMGVWRFHACYKPAELLDELAKLY
ncbi:DEAD/DEAH box helicase family protein [Phycisphaeraceae bacterium D3-23]